MNVELYKTGFGQQNWQKYFKNLNKIVFGDFRMVFKSFSAAFAVTFRAVLGSSCFLGIVLVGFAILVSALESLWLVLGSVFGWFWDGFGIVLAGFEIFLAGSWM